MRRHLRPLAFRVLWVLVAALLACDAPPPASPPEPLTRLETIERYTDLLRLGIHDQTVLAGARAGSEVWDQGAQYRPVLAQAAGRIELGPIPRGEGCRLEFGLGVQGDLAGAGLRARIGGRGADGVEQVLFEHALSSAPPGGWLDRTVPIPSGPAEDFTIGLEVEAAPGSVARVGWSAPHVICRVPRQPPPANGRPHILLISLDTLRPDHLGLYGYGRDTSPVLDALGARSWVFERAFAPSSWTLPSHASLFTSTLPAVHRAGHASPFVPLAPDDPRTLAEELRDAGYLTIGFTAGGLMSRRNGLERGFQWWTEQTRANLADTLPGFFDAIGTAPPKPLFLVLHTYDIHGPYAYLPGGDAIAVPRRAGAADPARPQCNGAECGEADWERIRRIGYHRYQRFERFESIGDVIDAYDRGIRFVDTQLGVLFDRLRDVGIYDQMMIVVTSDHGESLYERAAYFGHSYTLYDEEIRVPLIVRLPGGDRGRSDALVELTDLAPWILEVAGVARPASFEGRSPLERARDTVRGEASHTGQRWARSSDAKWIAAAPPSVASLVPVDLRDRLPASDQAFDMARDPGERSNRAGPDAEIPAGTAALRALAEAEPLPGEDNEKPAPALDDAHEQHLRELGYLR